MGFFLAKGKAKGKGKRPGAAPLGNNSLVVSASTEQIKRTRENNYLGFYGHVKLRNRLWRELLDGAMSPGLKAVLAGTEDIEAAKKILGHSCFSCGEAVIPSKKVVIRKGENGIRHYSGVRYCGSVWFCQSCARKIYAQRRKELQQLFDYFKDKKKTYSFVSLTVPHSHGQTFCELVPRLAAAVRALRSGRAWKDFAGRYGAQCGIRATEATYSPITGPHPHYHLLIVYDRPEISDEEKTYIEQYFKSRWHEICLKKGLIPADRTKAHLEHGCDVKTGHDPVKWDYLAKIKVWEMAGTTSKTARATGGLSMWEVQARAIQGEAHYQAVWFDFMCAMRHRSAIRWSPGLKTLVGIKDIADIDIVAEVEKSAQLEYVVPLKSFRDICRRGLRLQVLTLIESGRAKEAIEQYGLIPIHT